MPAPKAPTCTDTAVYDSLVRCSGKTLIPGNRKRFYYLPKAQIKTWPKLATPATALEDVKTIASYEGNFVLEAEAKWLAIDNSFNKGRYTHETQGPGAGSNTVLNKYEAFYGDTDEAASAVAAQLINDDIVVAFQRRDGRFRILGNPMFDTVVTTSSDSGEGVTDESGMKITFECSDTVLCPFYPGKLETVDGDLDGKTGLPLSPEAA